MRPAAIFDLDGTLLCGVSAERRWIGRAVRSGALSPLRLVGGGLAALLAWLSRRTASPFETKPYLRGTSCGVLEQVASECVARDIVPHLRPDLRRELERHRAAGDVILLLTGTPDVLGTRIAAVLGVDAVIASRLERDGERFTGGVVPPHPYGPGKRVALEAWAATAGVDLERSHAYANRRSDVAHLECVGHPHAVAPDRGLRQVAVERGWRIWEAHDGQARPGG